MGAEFKTVTNDTKSHPGKILIVRHQFMRKVGELVFSAASRPARYARQLKVLIHSHPRSL
jgi:hypothetical protein